MKTEVKDLRLPTRHEEESLALEVLELLDGLGVGAIAGVLDVAAGLARTYTPFDFKAPWFQKGVVAHQENAPELA